MRTFKAIFTTLAMVLFFSVMFVPSEGADWQVSVLWAIWVPSALYIANLIFKRLEEEDMK